MRWDGLGLGLGVFLFCVIWVEWVWLGGVGAYNASSQIGREFGVSFFSISGHGRKKHSVAV